MALLLICIFPNARAQAIRGVVTNKQGEPLPFAHIVTNSGGKGVVADLNGAFAIVVGDSAVELRVSYIGYKTKVVNVDATNNERVIVLEEGSVLLPGITITSAKRQKELRAGPIMDSVLAHLSENHPVRAVSFLADFRQLNVLGMEYTRLIEARLALTDDGSPRKLSVAYCIKGIKSSVDLREYPAGSLAVAINLKEKENNLLPIAEWLANGLDNVRPKDGISSILHYDTTYYPLARMFLFNNLRTTEFAYASPPYFGFFNADFLAGHKFKLKKVLPTIAVITILPSKKSPLVPIGSSLSNVFLPFGEVWVDLEDWGIHYFHYGYRVNPKYKNTGAYKFETLNSDILFENHLVFAKGHKGYRLKYQQLREKDRALKGNIIRVKDGLAFTHTFIIRELLITGYQSRQQSCRDNIYSYPDNSNVITEKEWNLADFKYKPLFVLTDSAGTVPR